jgi:hypothetical protein
MLLVTQTTQCHITEWLMYNKLEKMQKEAVLF